MTEQEARGGKFLPAFFVEPVLLGEEFASGELPLHMTYFPPVKAELTPELVGKLRTYVNPMPPFMATVGESALFGPEHDIHVKRVESTPQLQAVHRRLVAVLQYLPHSSVYRIPYNPHITLPEGDSRVQTGDKIEVGGFSIIEKTPHGSWQVMAKIGLKGADMQTDATLIKKV